MEIIGLTHPIPTKFAERIYNENKTVFVGKKNLYKAIKGSKFIIYESQGAMAYTGMAEIEEIGKMKTSTLSRKFKNELIVTSAELKEYAKGREEMSYIKFKNFHKFTNPVKPKRFVSIGGKYIYKDEFEMIEKNKE